ncbi:3-oxoacyl-[acyl-carrier protein] reductase [Maribacter vaceletii]|uniref:3-oxoacyl-[acyl-carrier protein] reductase n=1 Tax=Maribacter vaceletii TaxID=1206816 RepID=A0A495EGW2_9FLAO|nr:SDR family oxidoreductase [Maribacter vaceletii]RKR15197.1 3-oxoacyl-[acyl-carrier protein] reductase [Maribacter vaceletii]
MNLHLKDKLFLVGGATSGFGKAITEQLIAENATVIAVARTLEKLKELQKISATIEIIPGDLSDEKVLDTILHVIGERVLTGAVINSGGPPAMPVLDTKLSDWDEAYKTVVRWKIALTQALLPKMIEQQYGRLLYIESVSVKQPVENLVLSNSMRLAVVGYVKTLSQEIGTSGVTLNILGPGFHATQRMENLFKKNSELKGIPESEIRASVAKQTAMEKIGKPEDFASLALWLLSPHSSYISGQTISVDGGLVKGTMG